METSTSRGQSGQGGRQSAARGDGAAKGDSRENKKLKGLRKSCDACGRSKKRCDGERPCR